MKNVSFTCCDILYIIEGDDIKTYKCRECKQAFVKTRNKKTKVLEWKKK